MWKLVLRLGNSSQQLYAPYVQLLSLSRKSNLKQGFVGQKAFSHHHEHTRTLIFPSFVVGPLNPSRKTSRKGSFQTREPSKRCHGARRTSAAERPRSRTCTPKHSVREVRNLIKVCKHQSNLSQWLSWAPRTRIESVCVRACVRKCVCVGRASAGLAGLAVEFRGWAIWGFRAPAGRYGERSFFIAQTKGDTQTRGDTPAKDGFDPGVKGS